MVSNCYFQGILTLALCVFEYYLVIHFPASKQVDQRIARSIFWHANKRAGC